MVRPIAFICRTDGNTVAAAVTLSLMVSLVTPSHLAQGSVVFPQDEAASLSLGATMALNDQIRQLQFDIIGGSISRVHGTATPLGPWYSGISQHWLSYIVNTSGSSNFTITIATGADRDHRVQVIPIVSYLVHPTQDFVLLQHSQPVLGATIPVFGTVEVDDIVTFVGLGNRHLFGQTTYVNDGRPSAFNMQLFSKALGPAKFQLWSDYVPSIPGGGMNFDSSSPGYNSAGQLCLLMQGGNLSAPEVGVAADYALSFVATGVSTFIETNTPLNNLPPELQCGRVAGGVRISWDVRAIGWTLQRTDNLQGWSDLGGPITAAGSYTDTSGSPRAFFRLRQN